MFGIKDELGGRAAFLFRNTNEPIRVLVQFFVGDCHFALWSPYTSWSFAWLFNNRSLFMDLWKARALLFLRFLFIVQVRGTFSSELSPCTSRNGYFPLLLVRFRSILLRSVRVFGETDPKPCAKGEKISLLRPERSRESLTVAL